MRVPLGMIKTRRLALGFFPVLFCLPAAGQTVLHTLEGANGSEGSSTVMAVAGDVNGDGMDDWIVGVRTGYTTGQSDGIARMYSGADGTLLYNIQYVLQSYQQFGANFGSAVDGVGDLDGDGLDDFIIGAAFAPVNGMGAVGYAKVYSGLDASVLFTVEGDSSWDRFGAAVSGAGDLNGDGTPDFVVGAPGDDSSGNNGTGSVSAYSGLDGSLLYRRYSIGHHGLGYSVDGAGDVNGDGFDDVVVTALAPNGNNASGRAAVLSGATGTPIHLFDAQTQFEWFGVDCAGAGDVDGDGFDDVIIGVKQDMTVGYRGGAAKVYSGATGGVLHTFLAESALQCFGASVAGAGDVDGDGFADLAIGAPGAWGAGRVTVFSGANGDIIYRRTGIQGNGEYGAIVRGGGDFNGDGFPDLLAYAPGTDTGGLANNGTMHVVTLTSAACSAVTGYCSAAPNSTGGPLVLYHSGTTSLAANDLLLHGVGGPSGVSGIFFMGSGQTSIPFGNGQFCVGGSVRRVVSASVNILGQVAGRVDSAVPSIGALTPGSTWNFQYIYRDVAGAGFNASSALSVVFCP